jgi:hypothetical protein
MNDPASERQQGGCAYPKCDGPEPADGGCCEFRENCQHPGAACKASEPDSDCWAVCGGLNPAPAATRAGDKWPHVELSAEQEERFSGMLGSNEWRGVVRWAIRTALMLNTTKRGLIDYGPAVEFAKLAADALAAQPPQAPPAAPSAVQGEALFTPEHVAYVTQYGGHCRDCADENGVCPSSGLPCGGSEKAIRFVFNALSYGVKHKYISSPFVTQPAAPVVRKSLSASVADALRPFLSPGQKVIWREPFRWFDDNGVLSNHYDGMSVPYLAQEFGYEVIHDCECAAVIAAAPKTGGANG